MDRLLEEVELVTARGRLSAVEVGSVEYDSRLVGAGALFCCVPGARLDGHDFAPEAVARGASALLVERPLELGVAQAVVPRGAVRRSMARAAAALYGYPSRKLRMVGVTGTNGKTTVTHLLAAIFEAHGMRTTVIGTLGGSRTTPEAPVLQRLLADALSSGEGAVAMEVSSHALTLDRVEGICFDAAVFTNLGHDHLDHHGTMEEYFAAKASLFVPGRASKAVVRIDDPWGRRLADQALIEVVGYSMADATEVEIGARRTSFVWRGRRIDLALAGSFQVPNALAAATTAVSLGVPEDEVSSGLAAARPVHGRFEVIETSAPFTIVVDYAHTPEGLEVSLGSARTLARGHRVLVVFGAGGERDHQKRPAMGVAAARGADVVLVTSDNPRGEDPSSIIAQVTSQIPSYVALFTEIDRRRAIEEALELAAPGDVVLIAGKGHETDIEIGGRRIPFDDREVARSAAVRFAERDPGTGSGS